MVRCCSCLTRWLCGLLGRDDGEDSRESSVTSGVGRSRAADYYVAPPLAPNHLALAQSFDEEYNNTGASPLLPKCSNRSFRASNTSDLLSATALGPGLGGAPQPSCSSPGSFSHRNTSAEHKARHRRTGSEASKHRLQHQLPPPAAPVQASSAAADVDRHSLFDKLQVQPTFHDIDQEKAAVKKGLASSKTEDEDDSYYCPTCLEAYTAENPKKFTACGHHFHLPCLFEWLERKDTCPICESKLQFEGLD